MHGIDSADARYKLIDDAQDLYQSLVASSQMKDVAASIASIRAWLELQSSCYCKFIVCACRPDQQELTVPIVWCLR